MSLEEGKKQSEGVWKENCPTKEVQVGVDHGRHHIVVTPFQVILFVS